MLSKKPLDIAAVILLNGDKILIAKRAEGGNCGGKWEFPGGKVEKGETLEQCAIRECQEELGVTVHLTGLFGTANHRYPDNTVAITFYTGIILQGDPLPRVHQQLAWVTSGQLGEYSFCTANQDILEKLSRTL